MKLSGSAAWWGVTALAAAPAVGLALGAGSATLDLLAWKPAQVEQAWRWWSAAWVHLSTMHLQANLLGAMLVGVLGAVARVPMRAALAWAAAWPLVHLALWVQPDLVRYGGLSGVLHAGVAVVVVATWRTAPQTDPARWTAALLGLGLLVKVAWERPWAHTLTHPSGWDIAVAPGAHAAGLVCGALCAWLICRPARPREDRH